MNQIVVHSHGVDEGRVTPALPVRSRSPRRGHQKKRATPQGSSLPGRWTQPVGRSSRERLHP
eukprot:10250855-Lingulodinium_polyedra.AAC.1